MIARAPTAAGPPPVWTTADIAAYLRVSNRSALRWTHALLAWRLEPISWKPLRVLQDDFIAALRRRAADLAAAPT